MAELGVPASADAYSGVTSGGFISTSYINPSNWTRSYSRAAYIDPLPPRPNLSILPNATVTRIIFASNSTAGNLTANSVQYAAYDGAKTFTVNVTKEVILSGGVIGTPQVLMLSGVGPEDVLEAAGVTVLNALPGVGQHLQDHLVSFLNPVYVPFSYQYGPNRVLALYSPLQRRQPVLSTLREMLSR